MKKLTTLLISFFLILADISIAQVSVLWEKSAANSTLPTWFSSASSTERGMGYGVVNGNHRLYIVSRNGGNFIYVYNALNGDSVGTLSTAGISGGAFPINDAGVSDDGLIFVCNLTTGASTSPFKVYKYTTEADSPVVAINYTAASAVRLGDKFTVTGSASDNSLTIWAASGNSSEVYKFTTTDNGNTFNAEIINISSTGSSPSVGPIDSAFYYNANGTNPIKFDANGTSLGTIPGSVVATGSNAIRFLGNILSDEYVATFAYGTGNQNARIVRVPFGIPANAELYGVTPPLGSNSNGNGTGDVEIRKVSELKYQVFVLATNNGFGAYEINIAPLTLPIAVVREDTNNDLIPDRLGDTVTIGGIIISPNYQTTNHSYYVWDGTAGITEFLGGTTSPTLNLGDSVYMQGVVGQFRGLTQIQPFSSSHIIYVNSGNPTPDPVVLTMAEYMQNPESYEGTLIGFVSVNKVSGNWPSNGSATLVVTDGTDTIDLRIDSDTDLDNNPEPTWPVDIIGLGSQFSSGSTVLNDGYQLLPRYYATDILPAGTIPVELSSFVASVSNGKVILSWATITETNNKGFAVEKSSGSEFEQIGFVDGKGTTTEKQFYTFTDNTPGTGVVRYRLKQIDFNGTFKYSDIVEVDVNIPAKFDLAQNYPNPFNPTTTIRYSIANPVNVSLIIYNTLGEEVMTLVNNQFTEPGVYNVVFDASNLASGTYIYRLTAGDFVMTKKMVLTK
ncbi:DUF4623 domain-containing protein [Ignavibacterium sp.]|uniref:T9SS type A sorting domain-containing protein n=1 Tax=Ignavibacterium sp. TaxID=2651167 RepID=UPI0021FAC082|nr:DUF4623 domain-containing protein [Ignavibacterium sp.]BDQ03192.1 MAG: hypothetical protein KatS3mg037_1767 [Ignavibacterium sp.]